MPPRRAEPSGDRAVPRAGLRRSVLIPLVLAGIGLGTLLLVKPQAPSAPRPAAEWKTDTAGWEIPMPDRVRAAGIAAGNILFLQNGRDIDIHFRSLAIEKHPALKEARLIALTMRIEPHPRRAQPPQSIEGILSERRPVLVRTNISLRAEGAVECLKTGRCELWLELTLQESGGKTQIERSRRMRIPVRPVV